MLTKTNFSARIFIWKPHFALIHRNWACTACSKVVQFVIIAWEIVYVWKCMKWPFSIRIIIIHKDFCKLNSNGAVICVCVWMPNAISIKWFNFGRVFFHEYSKEEKRIQRVYVSTSCAAKFTTKLWSVYIFQNHLKKKNFRTVTKRMEWKEKVFSFYIQLNLPLLILLFMTFPHCNYYECKFSAKQLRYQLRLIYSNRKAFRTKK